MALVVTAASECAFVHTLSVRLRCTVQHTFHPAAILDGLLPRFEASQKFYGVKHCLCGASLAFLINSKV